MVDFVGHNEETKDDAAVQAGDRDPDRTHSSNMLEPMAMLQARRNNSWIVDDLAG